MREVVQIICTSEIMDYDFPFRKGMVQTSTGSAFFLKSNDNYLVTCYHCVKNAIHVEIVLPSIGKKRYSVEIISICPLYDIALLRLNSENTFPHGSFNIESNSISKVKVGDKVEAIGFPLGQSNIKMTRGIISGHQFGNYQTDSPVNPGNSGGPLLWNGKIIGIVSSGFLFSNDIGYAIPIEKFLNCFEMMKKSFIITPPPYLGLCLQNPIKPKTKGMYIYNFLKKPSIVDGAIPKFKVGDVLIKLCGVDIIDNGFVNKKWMDNFIDIETFLSLQKMGKDIPFTILRGSKTLSGKIILKKPKLLSKENFKHPSKIQKYIVIGGLVVIPMTMKGLTRISQLLCLGNPIEQHKNIIKFQNTVQNLMAFFTKKDRLFIVVNILSGSMFDHYFEKFDIISYVNKKPMKTLNDFKKIFFGSNINSYEMKMLDGKMFKFTQKELKEEEKKLKDQYQIENLFQI